MRKEAAYNVSILQNRNFMMAATYQWNIYEIDYVCGFCSDFSYMNMKQFIDSVYS